METKCKSNLSNMEQKELSKLTNDENIVIKPAGKGGAVVTLSTCHYQSMIMQHLSDENTNEKLGSCIDSKIQSDLSRFLRKYKMCFTEPKWKFLNDKHHEVSNFYGLPKIHKSMVIESAINTQNSEIIEIFKHNYLKLRPIEGGPKRRTRKLSQLIDIPLKPFLKRIKSFIRDSLDFLHKCARDVNENTEIVTLNVISLFARIPHEFGLEAIEHFLNKYQEDLQPRFRKEFVLESANFILKTTH